MEIVYLVSIILILVIVICLVMYNIILVKHNDVMNAFSSLDVMLKKRYDLVPNLVSCVKGYADHEKKVLEKITEIRKEAMSVYADGTKTFELNNSLNNNLKKVIGVAENHPNLKANENFLQLQEKLADIEEYISAARRNYNAHANSYNTFISMIPINIFALLLGYKKEGLFETIEKERESKNWLKDNE